MKAKIQKLSMGLMVVTLLALAMSVEAITVNWSAVGYTVLALQGGTVAVPQGALLQIGVLTTNEETVVSYKNNPVMVQSFFNAWTNGYVGAGTDIDGSWTYGSGRIGTGFYGLQIYLLAFDTASAETATQVGLYTSKRWNWYFPTRDDFLTSIDIEDEPLEILIGSYSSNSIVYPPEIEGWNALQLHQIPEPSTAVLVGAALLGLVGLWRRRIA